MRLIDRLTARPSETRYTIDDYLTWVYNGAAFPYGGFGYDPPGKETIREVADLYESNPVVFACCQKRLSVFSEARFMYQRLEQGKPGKLFGLPSLSLLERPWANAGTGELLARVEQDVTRSGNFFATRVSGRSGRPEIRRLNPAHVTIVLGSKETSDPEEVEFALDCEPVAYLWTPRPDRPGRLLMVEDVAHFSPIPDPKASYRGMSWLSTIVPEVRADNQATEHKAKFFENGATIPYVLKPDASLTADQFARFVADFNKGHQGNRNAYKALVLGGGADITPIGTDLRQLDFRQTQGAGETRICAAASVPPVVVGLSEGLQAATYSNYGQARRHFADSFLHPQWRGTAQCLERLVPPPDQASRLWYDGSDIPFLRDDERDMAEIRGLDSRTIRTLVDAGYTSDSVVAAVTAGDMTLLRHSGLYSVQLQPAGNKNTPAAPADDDAA